MKLILTLLMMSACWSVFANVWKVLPAGVRIVGYRNVTTSKITKNFNQSGQESSLGSSFRVDASTFNEMTGNLIAPNLDPQAYGRLVVGEYKVDADAQVTVHGSGFGYGITDSIMFYGQVTYYQANVRARIKRTAGNSYEEVARLLEQNGGTQNTIYAENLRQMVDANESTIQSVITNYYGYKPVGDWSGRGYGDTEVGFMTKLIDKGYTGLMFYPGANLPTGRQDNPDILQDIGFGDGQFDLFGELATGYNVNDRLTFGTFLRYTYQAPTSRSLRVPSERDFQLSSEKAKFDVKYGDRINWIFSSTLSLSDWVSITPMYRFMHQMKALYSSKYGAANEYLSYNSDRTEHQAQLTTTLSSITPFLNKEFLLPAQVNLNLVKTLSGKNVPAADRFEVEFRMLF